MNDRRVRGLATLFGAFAALLILVMFGVFAYIISHDPRLQPAAGAGALARLPLIEVRAAPRPGDAIVVYYSGDNGWQNGDREFAEGLARAGAPVVAFDSLRYFVHRRTPEGAAADLAAVIQRYGDLWGRSRVVLVGYSFGADALPLVARSLPPEVRRKVSLVALIAPGGRGELMLRPYSLFDLTTPFAKPIGPEIAAMGHVRAVCIFGHDDVSTACPRLPTSLIQSESVPGGHRFKNERAEVARLIAGAAGLAAQI
jgi:type IV secretory pathway VirJ component